MNKIILLLAASWLGLSSVCSFAAEVDLTRFGPREYSPDIITPNVEREAFFGVPGEARLIISPIDTSESETRAVGPIIHLNGARVFSGDDFAKSQSKIEIPVQLVETNSIRVEYIGYKGVGVEIRVKQRAQVDLNLSGRIHFNINTSNFKRSKQFYRRLGFVDAIGPFPETNTIEVAHSIGVKGPYHFYAEILYLGRLGSKSGDLLKPHGRFIDMIEWKNPLNESPAYPHLYHLGISRVAFSTTHLEADMNALAASGAEFLSAPARRVDGSRFVIGRDPDGTFFELLERQDVDPKRVNNSYVEDVHHLTINVSDFERSREFYRMLGFTRGIRLPETESLEVAQAMGVHQPYRVRAEMLVHEKDGSRIELVEWLQPRDLSPPYPYPINNYGIHRINYATGDLAGDITKLKAQGVTFLSKAAPCCEGELSKFGIVLMFDPDGAFVQLMGAIDPAAKGNNESSATE